MADDTYRINGKLFTITKAVVEAAVKNVEPDPVRTHGVKIGGRVFPVKQVLALVTGQDRLDFPTNQARNVLQRIGFKVARH